MIVMKFGGTSVESASAIERVACIVGARRAQAGGGGFGDGQNHEQAAGDSQHGDHRASAKIFWRAFTTARFSLA